MGSNSKNNSSKGTFSKIKREVRLMYREFSGWIKQKVANRKIEGSPRSFRKKKRTKTKSIEKSSRLIKESLKFVGEHWKTLGLILLAYIGVYFVLAYATPNINLQSIFNEASQAGAKPGIASKLETLTGALFTYRSEATDFARWAQFFLAVIFSIIFIYAIRNLHRGTPTRARDALYSGTVNLIPFVLGICLIAIELIPFTLIGVSYNLGMSRGLFIGALEKYTAVVVLVLAGLLTFWFIPTAIISLYAVTVPGVYPSKAMQAVRIMVSNRRLEVVRHLTVFVLFIFVSYMVLLLLLVTYLPRFANLSLDLFFLTALPLIHVMMYKLYLRLLEGAQKQS